MIRRLLRYSFTLLSALSLLLCAAVAVLWARSDREAHFVDVQGPHGECIAWASRGEFAFHHRELGRLPWAARHTRRPWPVRVSSLWVVGLQSGYADQGLAFTYRHHRRGGFHWLSFDVSQRRYRYATLPAWSLCALLIVLPACAVVLHVANRARRHVRPGLCPACHYDLRATPRRCPECGAVPAAGVKA
jgi:hypothetical protein